MTTATKSAGSSAPRFNVGDEVWLMSDFYLRPYKDKVISYNQQYGVYDLEKHGTWYGEPRLFATSAELLEDIKTQILDMEKEIESLKANQKAPWRKCNTEEKPRDGHLIIYKGSFRQGFYSTTGWWLNVEAGAFKQDQAFIEASLSWKYVEEL